MPELFQCLDCNKTVQLNKHGYCEVCGSNALTLVSADVAPNTYNEPIEIHIPSSGLSTNTDLGGIYIVGLLGMLFLGIALGWLTCALMYHRLFEQ